MYNASGTSWQYIVNGMTNKTAYIYNNIGNLDVASEYATLFVIYTDGYWINTFNHAGGSN